MLIVPSSRNALPLGRWISTGAILPPRGYLTMSRGISGFHDLVQRWGGEGGGGGLLITPQGTGRPHSQELSCPNIHSAEAGQLSSRPLLHSLLFPASAQTPPVLRGPPDHPTETGYLPSPPTPSHSFAVFTAAPSLSEIILLVYFYLTSVFPLLGHPGGFHSH